MLRKTLLVFALSISISTTGCTISYLDKIIRKSVGEYRLSQKAHATAGQNSNSNPITFPERHRHKLLALLFLFSVWLTVRFQASAMKNRQETLDAEDLGMLRVVKDLAAELWEKYDRKGKVIDLKVWRKGK